MSLFLRPDGKMTDFFWGLVIGCAGALVARFVFQLPNWQVFSLLAALFYGASKMAVQYLQMRREEKLDQPQTQTVDVIDLLEIASGGFMVYLATMSIK